MLYWTPKLPLFRTVLRPNYDRIATYFEWVVKFTTEENLVIRFTVFLESACYVYKNNIYYESKQHNLLCS